MNGILLANGAGEAGFFGMGGMIIYLIVIFGFIYMFMMRPQRKERKRMQDLLAQLAVGDAVMTSSGFYGTVIDINDDTVIIEFGNNKNCRIPMQKTAITQVEKASTD
ncbi:MAG: preprotein translocase subunit YajC [Lachnospiraceae bacterium]|jgi:preprotein translocase subunit YajC|nr:preprotein translocase subunit YajC [Lachnospiraceae bacterium]